MPEQKAEIVVVGAGPGGLATAAALRQKGLPALVLERTLVVGSSWRRHYDRLHLHTVRWLSGLPGLPIPGREGRWVSRDGFVSYLEAYAQHHRLDIRRNTEVRGIFRDGNSWRIATSQGELSARRVVLATGQNRVPFLPPWPGVDGFQGRLLHSSGYRSGAEMRGKDVLVVGAGNSGAEIAVDLVEQGAARVRLSVRRAPNVIERTVAGFVPAQLLAIALGRLPLQISDGLSRATARITVGDLTRYGLPAPERGIYTQMIRDRQIPILDVGFLSALRRGEIEVVPAVLALEGPGVRLLGGRQIEPEVVIAATGFRPGLEPLVNGLGVLLEDGSPRVHGERTAEEAPALHLVGFGTPPGGQLRQIAIEARRIARTALSDRSRSSPTKTWLTSRAAGGTSGS